MGVDAIRDRVLELRCSGRTAVVTGGKTLLHVAAPAPHDEVLSTLALNAIAYHEPADLIATCEAGVTLGELNERLARAGQVLPVWHPAPERATVGGLVAFGWTGLGRRLYGRLRDRVLEVRVVTGEGKVIRGGARVVKNVTGFDLPRLFVGSMGTLGVIVELSLKVHPRPPSLWCTSRAGAGTVGARRVPAESVLEFRDGAWTAWAFAHGPLDDARVVLGEEPGPGDEAFARLASDPVLCGGGTGLSFRAAVPPSRIPELIERLAGVVRSVVDARGGVAWVAAEAGAGYVRGLREFCEGAGGSLVLTGKELRSELGVWGSPPRSVEVMRRLKSQFDPDDVLGRGRLFVADSQYS